MAPGNTQSGIAGLRDPLFRRVLLAVALSAVVSILCARVHLGFGLAVAVLASMILALAAIDRVERLRRVVGTLAGESGPEPDGSLSGLADAVERASERSQHLLSELRRERDDFQGILRGTSNGILLLDDQMRVERINESAHRLLGTPAGSLGRRLDELARNLELFDLAERARLGEEPAPRQIELYGSQGAKVLHVTATRVADTGGDQRVLIALHDVTDLRRLQRVRTDFVANVTHEMRSPLASILGFAETIAADPESLPPGADDGLQRIIRNAKRLDHIINDLVELSRLEHAMAPEVSEVQLDRWLEELVAGYQDDASEKNLRLEYAGEGLDHPIELDAVLLAKALSNLLDNAIKYSFEGGTIEVFARRDGSQLEIAVRDQGPGIPLEHQARIFERFYRVDAARSRAVGGTGLGLAIAKHAAALHGGRLRVENNSTRGATFTLSLPLEAPVGDLVS